MLEAGGRVQSIEKAVRILEILAEAGTPMPLREIARRTELPKSTLHGIISTLRETGLVEQSAEDGCYGLGLHLFELGCAASGSRNITAISRPFLQSLANRAGETAFLAALDGTDALLLEVTEAPNPLRVALAPGTRMPLHCTAQGKVFLAWNENAMRQVCRWLWGYLHNVLNRSKSRLMWLLRGNAVMPLKMASTGLACAPLQRL